MLLRGSNAVGYSAYPDNLIISFIEKAAETGVDIFRIFDSMNWLPAMEESIRAVRERTESLAEVSLCYTGDISDKTRTKYSLEYYTDLAKRIEDAGAHILAIKDMAGLLKPYAAEALIPALREAVDIPIHLHTHDTSAIQTSTYLKAIEAGVDVVDVALASMSGLTSQPNFNSLVAALKGSERDSEINLQSLNAFSRYWEAVREYYYPFESGLKAGTAEVYDHEIPGGQYSNLRPQARALGLEEKFEEMKENYREVNALLGDLVKVTPSSKVVGDFALFMTSNGLNIQDVVERAGELSFPESVKSFFRGDLGQPHGGFPAELQKAVLRGEEPYTCRPNEHLAPIALEEEFADFQREYGEEYQYTDYLSSKLYPAVFQDFYEFQQRYGEVRALPTPAFFYGMQSGEEILVDIDRGKTLMVRLVYVTDPDDDGVRTVVFKLNGQTRGIDTVDQSVHVEKRSHPKAEGAGQVGSPLQGRLSDVLVESGQRVEEGDVLFVIEAMKMESSVSAQYAAVVERISLQAGELVEQDDLVVELSRSE
jgi:pyruvate carboxylase